MKLNNVVRKAITVASVAGLTIAGLAAVPAANAARSTVVVHYTNAFTSLNSGTPDTNLVTNSDVGYMTGMGFYYYDDKKTLVPNTVLGTYKVVKRGANDFRTSWTINKGRLWSDGTEIDARDMLLGHVLSSSAYSKSAGLGDPADEKNAPVFNSGGYGGTYDEKVAGVPTISADKMTLTIQYTAPVPNWELQGLGVSAGYTLVHIADGKKSLQSVAANNAAKDALVKAIQGKDTAFLKKIAKVWNEAYNIQTIDSNTNPLLLVSNGAYLVKSAVKDQSITMTTNPKYNSGPKVEGGIDTVVFRFIADGTAASQALANGEIDLYSGQATADAVTQLKAMKNVTVLGGVNACYEHIDLRVGPAYGTKDVYKGPFADSSPNGKKLRQAFLLAYPREEILAKIIKPVNPSAVALDSTFTLPGQANYDAIARGNGYGKYSQGTQAERTAKALRLVRSVYPKASETNPGFTVKLMQPSPNARRAAQAALIVPALAKAGIKVEAIPTTGWSGKLDVSDFDAQFFAWCPSAVLQAGTNANFLSDGTNNFTGWNNANLDRVLKQLNSVIPDTAINRIYVQAERIISDQAWTLGVFQHPAVTAFNATLKGIKPAPLTPNLVWNFWEWSY
jgi:peptide/nickel transport system substrate-binding protein